MNDKQNNLFPLSTIEVLSPLYLSIFLPLSPLGPPLLTRVFLLTTLLNPTSYVLLRPICLCATHDGGESGGVFIPVRVGLSESRLKKCLRSVCILTIQYSLCSIQTPSTCRYNSTSEGSPVDFTLRCMCGEGYFFKQATWSATRKSE
jgi:hypothetical protein